MELIELIKESNLFNFAIFMIILIIIANKIDISAMLEKAKLEIIQKIEVSKDVKANSDKELQEAQKSADSVGNEILDISKTAELNAENLKSNMISDADKKADLLKENAEKVIDLEEKNLSSLLTANYGSKSLELAKKHIIDTLKGNKDLQRRFVEYSLDELEGLWV